MQLDRALSQIEEIHGHLVKTEVYRGYRSIPVAITGVVAFAAGLLQSFVLPGVSPATFVEYWVALAVASVLVVGSEIVYNYVARAGVAARRTTRRVVGQLSPSLAAGLVVTVGPAALDATHVHLLPGIWAVLFSLGIFSSRPYLPRAIGWVALFYLVAGAVLLALSESGLATLSLAMGATFGAGQLCSALVLYWNLERVDGA